MANRYTFGDGTLAAERLALLARVFEPASAPLVRSAVPPGADVVLDLGCGPGATTRMIARECRPRLALGLDASPRFVAAAREGVEAEGGDGGDGGARDGAVAFAVHDVTAVPFPRAPVDAVYARFLLAHLADPLGLVDRWRTQLRPGGVLVLDEIEDMTVPGGTLRAYEDLVTALVAAEGGTMCAGPLLAPLGGTCVEHPVDAATAARLYAMNLATWGPDAVARGLADEPGLDELAAGLAAVQEAPGRATVLWTLRHVVLR
ncbi:MAG TPA: class I SAM-dependent methyltransferase [Acidimicrobiales bacterium]